MIDHITIRVNDLGRSKDFYERTFQSLGYKVSFGEEKVFWAFDMGKGFLFDVWAD